MIVVAGASGGLGRYLVDRLSGDFEMIGTYHNRKPELDRPIAGLFRVDVTDPASIDAFVAEAGPLLQRVVLVNLVGITLDGMGHKLAEATWDRVLDVNLKGTFLMCRALLPVMREQTWGRIINVSSVVGQMGVPGTVAYSSAKAGMFGMTRTLAAENASRNITVNTLALGYFSVGMINEIRPEGQAAIKATIPMKRFGDPRNFELAVRFLIESDYTTGSVININGGLV
jgi:NAD(P)-dependent dehydrogenase (short-subunit alcohol dehydrogenase family)